jgi:DNA-binding transcriptional ArsR family regulator
MDDALVDLVASRLRVIGQPVRIRLLARLREGPASVCELTEMINAVQQNVSQHLMILHQAGIVARQKQGTRMVYELADMHAITAVAAATAGLAKQSSDVASLTAKAGHTGKADIDGGAALATGAATADQPARDSRHLILADSPEPGDALEETTPR